MHCSRRPYLYTCTIFRGVPNPVESTNYEVVKEPKGDGMEYNLAYGDVPVSPNDCYDTHTSQEGEYSYAMTPLSIQLPPTHIQGETSIYEETS